MHGQQEGLHRQDQGGRVGHHGGGGRGDHGGGHDGVVGDHDQGGHDGGGGEAMIVMKAIVVKGLASCHICDKEDGDSKNGDKDDDRNAGNDTNNYVGYEGFCDRHLVSIGVA